MQLKEFRIQNYRSINDSGPIRVSKLTAFLGRNESGKSNILRALQSLNPAEGFKDLEKDKDFPRHRLLEEHEDSTPIVTSTWELSENERAQLSEIWPRAESATSITISRQYSGQQIVEFPEALNLVWDKEDIKSKCEEIMTSLISISAYYEIDEEFSAFRKALNKIEKIIAPDNDYSAWVTEARSALNALWQKCDEIGYELSEEREHIEHLAAVIFGDEEGKKNAKSWVIKHMPIFIFLDHYPELHSSQNMQEYLQRQSQGENTPADKNFGKMCKTTGLQLDKLQTLREQNKHTIRNNLASNASARITAKIQHLWRERPLKIRFDADAEHIHIFISELSRTHDVETNLNERSRGFQWFFSFYVILAAGANGGEAADAIFLLDEPGLSLHAKSQRDLLMYLDKEFENQILFTTHSPFMVPTHDLDSIRTVEFSKQNGTQVSNNPLGDSRTLFPLQVALGYDLAQSLFIGRNNLVVEGVTDFWTLSSISEYLSANGGTGLNPDIIITPAGGAQKMSYMAALLSSQNLKVLVLLDHEKNAMKTQDKLVKTKLIQDGSIISVSEAFNDSPPDEADIEDLLDPDVYENLVRESYATELKDVNLSPDDNTHRIAKRFKKAFKEANLEFDKTRPMHLLLKKMGNTPDEIVTPQVAERFNTLNSKINAAMKKLNGKNQ